MFNNFTVYFTILIIHELGHMLTGLILGEKIDKIKLYPYGGVTLFKPNYNIPLRYELIILINGPLLQIVGYLILKNFIQYDYLKIYHYTLLIFNLLPIYPLDGGKLINIIFNYHFNYKKSFKITYFISLILIILGIFYSIYVKNYNFTMILIIITYELYRCYRNLDYIYNNFLIERLLYNYKFKRIKCINNSNNFFRDCEHIIKMSNEKEYLRNFFHCKK